MRVADAPLGEQSQAALSELVQTRRAAFASRYQRALEAGQVNPSLTPDDAAYYLDAQITNVLVHLAAGEEPARVRAQANLALAALMPSASASTSETP